MPPSSFYNLQVKPQLLSTHFLFVNLKQFCTDAVLCVYVTALQVILCVGRDCLLAGDSCSSDETCSPRLRTLRQCVAGDGSVKLGPGARSQCANAVSALLSSPLHGCQCRRGMKREKNCLSIYWSLYQSGIHGEILFTAKYYYISVLQYAKYYYISLIYCKYCN